MGVPKVLEMRCLEICVQTLYRVECRSRNLGAIRTTSSRDYVPTVRVRTKVESLKERDKQDAANAQGHGLM